MIEQALTWGALIAAAGSIVAVAKFWMDMGATKQIAKDAKEDAATARSAASIAQGKAELSMQQLSEYKVEAAEKLQGFASINALAAAEHRFSTAVEGMRGDVRVMTERLDRLLDRKA